MTIVTWQRLSIVKCHGNVVTMETLVLGTRVHHYLLAFSHNNISSIKHFGATGLMPTLVIFYFGKVVLTCYWFVVDYFSTKRQSKGDIYHDNIGSKMARHLISKLYMAICRVFDLPWQNGKCHWFTAAKRQKFICKISFFFQNAHWFEKNKSGDLRLFSRRIRQYPVFLLKKKIFNIFFSKFFKKTFWGIFFNFFFLAGNDIIWRKMA